MHPSQITLAAPTLHDDIRDETLHLLPSFARVLLDRLIRLGLLDAAEVAAFTIERMTALRGCVGEERLGQVLVQGGLLTAYQLQRILSGAVHGLVLGQYRILDRIGKGGMGTVYRGEHRLMKRRVAIKVLAMDEDCPSLLKQRFYSEMRVLAELSHPNIVFAVDAGEVPGDTGTPPLIYLVMELAEGGDLEKHVIKNGLLEVPTACRYVSQAAAGLQAAHDRHLIHRDIKPSNLLLTGGREVKLVDFGLARQFASRLTDQRSLLGSIEFMPPEQSHDPSLVGKEADLYGLGATLFWLLTGEGPYPACSSVAQALRNLQQQPPRRLKTCRPDVPDSLDELVARLLDRQPANRPTSPLAVVNELRGCLASGPVLLGGEAPVSLSRATLLENGQFSVLVATDHLRGRLLHRLLIERLGCQSTEVSDAASVLQQMEQSAFDLLLLDLQQTGPGDADLCFRLRSLPRQAHLKILAVATDEDGQAPAARWPGADDYLPRLCPRDELLMRIRGALRLKAAEDRNDRLSEGLAQTSRQLERSQQTRSSDLREAHNALLFTLAKIAESRDGETPGHLRRMQLYTRALALEAACTPLWEGLVDEHFLLQLERCVPLHDIGKIGLPDDILLKPGGLTPTERTIVETHPLVGDRILEDLGKEYGATLDFLGMARVIVRSHHERYDGKGYPDRLACDAIPPAARLVAVADVYDTLRRVRLYKPAMSHAAAVQVLLERSPGQFDPTLVQALARCHRQFDSIYREVEE